MERIHGSTAMARPFEAGVAPAALATPAELFGLIYRQMRALAGRRDVDELAQAAAEQAVRALPSFEGRSKLSTWTYRICYLTLRKDERWTRRWLRRFTLTKDGELPETAAESSQADASLLREEQRGRLCAALDQLSSKRRAVVLLHDLEGLSVDEIAEIVGASARAVRSRLRDGRRALGQMLRSDPYFGVDACRTEER